MPARSSRAKPTTFKTPKPSRALARAARLAKIKPKATSPNAKKPKLDISESGSSSDSGSSYMSVSDVGNSDPVTEHPKGPVITIKNKNQVSPRRSERKTGEPKNEIIFEIYECNGEKFDGVLTRKDCKNLWIELGKNLSDLKRISRERVKGKHFKVCFYLKSPITITEISRRAEFNIEKTGDFGSTIYSIRLPEYYNIACKVGETATVSLKTSTIGIPEKVIMAWLKYFGKIQGSLR